MAASTNITPSLGVDLAYVAESTDNYRYDEIPLGSTVRGANGRMYIRAQAAGTVANDTAVVLTEAGAFTFVAGAGSWTTRAGAVASGDRCWIESNAI